MVTYKILAVAAVVYVDHYACQKALFEGYWWAVKATKASESAP